MNFFHARFLIDRVASTLCSLASLGARSQFPSPSPSSFTSGNVAW